MSSSSGGSAAQPVLLARAPEVIHVDMLGWFVLRRQSGSVDWLPKKAQALLAYLLMHPGRPIARDHLSTLLWAHRGSEQARRSLRQCVMSLREALGPGLAWVIASCGDRMLVTASEYIELDVRRFEALSRSERKEDLDAACALYRDEFLAGLQIASEPFAEWVQIERRRLAAMMSDLLHRIASADAAAGSHKQAIAAAQRLTEFDPLREDGHRLLMQLLAEAGQRSRALKQHALLVELLRRELGIAPDRETCRIADRIRNDEILRSSDSG